LVRPKKRRQSATLTGGIETVVVAAVVVVVVGVVVVISHEMSPFSTSSLIVSIDRLMLFVLCSSQFLNYFYIFRIRNLVQNWLDSVF